jgi:hypothetical protein
MKTFQVNDSIEFVCRSESTRYGFRHLVTLIYNGQEQGTDKLCYYNRTWERFEFESVLERIIDRNSTLSDQEKKLCREYLKSYGDRDAAEAFKTVAFVAKLGEVFGNTPEEKNAWKKRMLKAGLTNKGLEFPEDWDKLPEAEKSKRLDKAIEVLA